MSDALIGAIRADDTLPNRAKVLITAEVLAFADGVKVKDLPFSAGDGPGAVAEWALTSGYYRKAVKALAL